MFLVFCRNGLYFYLEKLKQYFPEWFIWCQEVSLAALRSSYFSATGSLSSCEGHWATGALGLLPAQLRWESWTGEGCTLSGRAGEAADCVACHRAQDQGWLL